MGEFSTVPAEFDFWLAIMAVDERKRRVNKQKFGSWEELPDGGRRYWYEVAGRRGWTARYFKEVDAEENTIRFWQEIYDERGIPVEQHIKYPVDAGHERLEG